MPARSANSTGTVCDALEINGILASTMIADGYAIIWRLRS